MLRQCYSTSIKIKHPIREIRLKVSNVHADISSEQRAIRSRKGSDRLQYNKICSGLTFSGERPRTAQYCERRTTSFNVMPGGQFTFGFTDEKGIAGKRGARY